MNEANPSDPGNPSQSQVITPSRAQAPGADHAALAEELREALRGVVDPEINLDIVTLGLIRDIVFDAERTDVRMILTTPFCPYAGTLVQQTKDVAREVIGGEVGVSLLDEPRWSPELMEGGDWSEWGLV